MGKFFSIPGVRIHQTEGEVRQPVDPSTHPNFKEFYDAKKRRGDDAKVGLPVGTPITLDGQPGFVEGEERSHAGDITTIVRGTNSTTRRVRWGQDKKGEITVAESKRTFE